MGLSHPLPTSACEDQSPTWGSRGSNIAFLSLLSWKLVETCGEQWRDATSALQHPSPSSKRLGVPPAPPHLAGGPQTVPSGLGERHSLTREARQRGMARVAEGLRRCKGSSCGDGSILGACPSA